MAAGMDGKADSATVEPMSRPNPLSPVGRETLQDRVYAELRRSLMNGMFDAGQMLRIQDLAEILQTSTMPVREALGRLVSEQALEALPNRSVRVPVITLERLDDLARARCLIEGELVRARLAAPDRARFRRAQGADGALRRGLRRAWQGRRACHVRAQSRLSFPHLPRRAVGGADPDRRKPVAAVRSLHPGRGAGA